MLALLLILSCENGFSQNYSAPSGAGSSGTDNTSLGTLAGSNGSYNTAIGKQAGDVVTGTYNSFLGKDAGKATSSSSYNSFFGASSGLLTTTGASNTFIGYQAGRSNITGSGNVFIGKDAGYNETGSNKLYIDNSSTSTPLILGDFSINQVAINALTGSYTLNVGGSINASSLFVGGAPYLASQWTTVSSNINYTMGGVSIGTANLPTGYKLAVGGKVISEEVVVQLQSSWPDYVFEKGYTLPTLEELQSYINAHKHLPGVPSTQEVKDNGVHVGEMNAILLKKIEEMTLYILDLKKEVDTLKKSQK